MKLSIFDRFVAQAADGSIVPYALVTVSIPGGGLALLYNNPDGTGTPLDNPFTADADGRAKFYLTPGRYNILVTWGDGSVLYADFLVLADPADVKNSVIDLEDKSLLATLEPEYDGQQFSIKGDGIFYYDAVDSSSSEDRDTYVYFGNRFKRFERYQSVVSRYGDYLKERSRDLSWLTQMDGKTVVITGDSLSYNNYGFGFSTQAEAYNTYPGIRSWPYMLRDVIHMNDPSFMYGDTIPWNLSADADFTVSRSSTAAYHLPFNNRSVLFRANKAEAVLTLSVFDYNISTNKVVVHLAHAASYPGKFDVYYNLGTGGSDVLVGNYQVGNATNYQGYDPFTISIPAAAQDTPVRIIFKNFTNADGSTPLSADVGFYLLGSGTKLTNVHTTGRGGWRADQLLADYENRIGQYNPDILVLVIGSNDRVYHSSEDFYDAFVQIIENARADNPEVQIIWVNPPPATGGSNPGFYPDTETGFGESMYDFLRGVTEYCVKNDVGIFDMYRTLYDLDKSEFFQDGIHLNRNGNSLIFKAFIGKFFPGISAPFWHFDGWSTYNYSTNSLMGQGVSSRLVTDVIKPVQGRATLSYNSTTKVWTVSGAFENLGRYVAVLKSVSLIGDNSSGNDQRIDFWWPVQIDNNQRYPFPVRPRAWHSSGGSIYPLYVRLTPLENNAVEMRVYKHSDGSLASNAELNGVVIFLEY